MKIKEWVKHKIRGKANINELIQCGMSIGEGCWFGEDCRFDWSFPWLICIGNNVTLSHGVDLIAHDASTQKCLGATRLARVIIEDNVFIGANTTVLPGVTIGSGSIIGAGSLVNKKIPPNEVWGGVPAKYICSLNEYVKRNGNLGVLIDATGIIHKCSPEKEVVKEKLLKTIDTEGEAYIK